MKWKFFVAAVIIVGTALWKAGVPLFPIVLGIAFAATLHVLQQTRRKRVKSGTSKSRVG